MLATDLSPLCEFLYLSAVPGRCVIPPLRGQADVRRLRLIHLPLVIPIPYMGTPYLIWTHHTLYGHIIPYMSTPYLYAHTTPYMGTPYLIWTITRYMDTPYIIWTTTRYMVIGHTIPYMDTPYLIWTHHTLHGQLSKPYMNKPSLF